VVLALLGPLLWPAALVVGHLALRRSKRTGQGGELGVFVVLVLLYAVSFVVLSRVLVIVISMAT
jgi:hypothetical protein